MELTDLPADYRLYVYAPDGSLAGLSSNPGLADEFLEVTAAQPGDYVVVVDSPAGAASTADYQLAAWWTAELPPVVEPQPAEAMQPTPTPQPGLGTTLLEVWPEIIVRLPTRPTPQPGPGTTLLADNFDDLTRTQLPLSETTPLRAQGYVNGEYEIINGNDSSASSVEEILLPGVFRDTTLAIDVRVVGGPSEYRSAVLVCRSGPSGPSAGYVFRAFPEMQRFVIARRQEGGPAVLVREASRGIRSGGVMNHFELTCAGATISASINGTIVASIEDSAYTGGSMRIGVGGTGATARFDNLVVTQR